MPIDEVYDSDQVGRLAIFELSGYVTLIRSMNYKFSSIIYIQIVLRLSEW